MLTLELNIFHTGAGTTAGNNVMAKMLESILLIDFSTPGFLADYMHSKHFILGDKKCCKCRNQIKYLP